MKASKLLEAVACGEIKIVQEILDQVGVDYAEPMTSDPRGITALDFAAANGWLAMVKYLVEERKANLMRAGCKPLRLAIMNARLEVLQYYLNRGNGQLVVDVLKTQLREPSCYKDNRDNEEIRDVIHFLIKNGADLSLQDFFDDNASTAAGGETLFKYLSAVANLFARVRAGNLTKASCADLLALGAHLDQKTPNLNTPLHLACLYENVETVKAILASTEKQTEEEQKELLSAKNKDGHTVLDVITDMVEKAKKSKDEKRVKKLEFIQNVIMNHIQALINQMVFRVRKFRTSYELPVDVAINIQEFCNVDFSTLLISNILVVSAFHRAMNSERIKTLAAIYRKETIENQKETSESIQVVLSAYKKTKPMMATTQGPAEKKKEKNPSAVAEK